MAKSDCTNILNLLPLYIDRMLSEKENDIVCKHLAGCKSCSDEYEFFKSVTEQFRSLPEIEVSQNFHERLTDKLAAEKITPQIGGNKRFGRRPFVGIAAAAAVVAVSVVSYMNLDRNINSVNPDEFVSPIDSSESSAQTKEQDNTEVLFPNTAEESEREQEHTSISEPDDILNAKKTAAAAETKNAPSRKQVNDSTAQNDRETENTSVPTASYESRNDTEYAETEAEPSVAAAHEQLDGGEIAAFQTADALDVSLDNAKPNETEADTAAGSGRTASESRSGAASSAMTRRAARGRVIHVSVAEEEIEQAKELLQGYTKDEIGYCTAQDTFSILSKLSELEGYRVTDSVSILDITDDYIVLEEL